MRRATVVFMFAALGCTAGGDEAFLDRGDPGKADLAGSCQNVECGDVSPDGCFCDHDCYMYGDCCSDKIDECGQELTFTTYNGGLVDAVGLVEQRRGPQLEALADIQSDVLCMQEVWTDEDAESITSGLSEAYPFSHRQVTSSDEKQHFACTLQVVTVLSLNSCVKNNCQNVSMFECIEDQCAEQYNKLKPKCQLCLSANSESPSKCVTWGAKTFANEGRNGLLMLSRYPMENKRYTEFETKLIKRGALTADVGEMHVQCTHMTAGLGSIPYPEGELYSSWEDEHLAQVAVLADEAGADRCTVLFGDMNAGPEGNDLDGELAENYDAIHAAGFVGDFSEGPCTHCGDNPLVGGEHSARIDHVFTRNCDERHELSFERSLDQPIRVTGNEGSEIESRLSDHYGITGTMSLFVGEQVLE